MVFVGVALILHVPIFFWRAHPTEGALHDPIMEIDFTVEEIHREKPVDVPPPPPDTSFLHRVKEKIGMATPAPLVVKTKPPMELLGSSSPTPQPTTLKITEKPPEKWVGKTGGLSGGFDVNKIPTRTESGLAGAPASGGGGTLKTKASSFRVAPSDLPIAVESRGGGLAGADPDAPVLATARRSDKGVTRVSDDFFGSNGGAPLKDKGKDGSGLVGVSGGSGALDPGFIETPQRPSSSAGLLAEASSVPTRGMGGPSKSPYEISGPLSGRKIVRQVIPPYPDWARDKGLIASVSLRFRVFQSGEVKPSIEEVRSSGYQQLNEVAKQALLQWRFEPLRPDQYGVEQWGIITFKFRAL